MTECPWRRYLRIGTKGCYITDGINKEYGDKEALLKKWSKMHLPNTGILFTVVDQTTEEPK